MKFGSVPNGHLFIVDPSDGRGVNKGVMVKEDQDTAHLVKFNEDDGLTIIGSGIHPVSPGLDVCPIVIVGLVDPLLQLKRQ